MFTWLVFACTYHEFAHSIRDRHARAIEEEGLFRSDSRLGYAPGDTFVDRFRLVELMHHPTEMNTPQSLLEDQGSQEEIPLEPVILNKYTEKPTYLGRGSFGETWKAYDSRLESFVAVKMFYKGNRHVSYFLDGKDSFTAKKLDEAAYECRVAKMMQYDAQKDPKGASRIMRCLEDHVSTESQNPPSSNPLYVVLEFCGDLDLQRYAKRAMKDDSLKLEEVQSIWEQFMEALSYMTNDRHKRRWVHHDLKGANIVIETGQGQGPLLKLIDFGSVTQTPPQTEDKPGSIGGGPKPLVTTPVFAPAELYEPAVKGRYIYPWSSYDMFQAASTFLEILTMHPWNEMLMWECYVDLYKKRKAMRYIFNPLNSAIKDCRKDLYNLQVQAQPRIDDIKDWKERDYYGHGAIDHLRKLVKAVTFCDANANRRISEGRHNEEKGWNDMFWAMSEATEDELDTALERMLPNRRALFKKIFDDYRAKDAEEMDEQALTSRRFLQHLTMTLSPFASERVSPDDMLHARLTLEDIQTPTDKFFKARPNNNCVSNTVGTCNMPRWFGGWTACPAHSTCITKQFGLFKECDCDPGYCVVDGECVLIEPPVLFTRHDGANAVFNDYQFFSGHGVINSAANWVECEARAAKMEGYIYTYFSQTYEASPESKIRQACRMDVDYLDRYSDELRRVQGMCVIWTYDIADAQDRLYSSRWDFISQQEIGKHGAITGVNMQLYTPEIHATLTTPLETEHEQALVDAELERLKHAFRPLKHRQPAKYRIFGWQHQRVLGYRD